jgi:hypothetical protein
MDYPAILLIPVFMLADYYLTLVGYVLREEKYGEHFKIDHYELNPVWQNVVSEKKWFNPRHLLGTIFITILLVYTLEYEDKPEIMIEFLLGFFLVGTGIIIGNHLRNILMFWHVIRKPDAVAGQVFLDHSFSLSGSMYEYAGVLVPLIMISLFTPSAFVIGAALSCALQMLVHVVWILIYRLKKTRAARVTK